MTLPADAAGCSATAGPYTPKCAANNSPLPRSSTLPESYSTAEKRLVPSRRNNAPEVPPRGRGVLCRLFGKTRNAFYDHQRRATAQALRDGLVLALVADIRTDLPRLGTRKRPHLLLPRRGEYAPRVGRDYRFALLAGHGLFIRHRERRVVTTQVCLPFFRRPDLIDHLTVQQAEQVGSSDSTYVRLRSGWSYLSLITDLYSHKIVGACLHPNLSVRGPRSALHQALGARTQPHRPLIHHSNRGLQYAAREYVGWLESYGVALRGNRVNQLSGLDIVRLASRRSINLVRQILIQASLLRGLVS